MHYHQYAFAYWPWIPTIEVIDGTSGSQIGQKDGFSDLDIKGINQIYCGELVFIWKLYYD